MAENQAREDLIKIVNDQRELIQDDLMCMLDGLDDDFLTSVCQVIVDRMEIIKNAIEEKQTCSLIL